MKLSPFLLAGSLAANLALAAALFLRAPANDSAERNADASASSTANAGTAKRATSPARASATLDSATAADLSGPDADARDLALGRTLARLIAQARAGRSGDAPWWSNKGTARDHEADLRAQRELSDAIVAAFGEDPLFGGRNNNTALLAFLPAGKRDALRRIVQDYDEMLAAFGTTGVELASDREKQKLLRAERDRDIAALLTPEELAAYELRTSATAATLKARFGDAIASEEEFARIYALQKAFDERFPREALSGNISMETLRARADAARQLQADMAAAVGSERYAALNRAADPELRTLDSLVSRLNLPTDTTDRIAATRDAFSAESQRINADPSLTPQNRRQQIIDLAARARSELTSLLGTEGAEAYLQRSAWVSMLQGGTAYSNTPPEGALALGNGPGVFPVAPRGVSGNSAVAGTRQILSVTSTGSAAPTSDAFVIGGGPTSAGSSAPVMMFSAAIPAEAVSTSGTLPASATTYTITNGQPAPAPKPTPGATPKQ